MGDPLKCFLKYKNMVHYSTEIWLYSSFFFYYISVWIVPCHLHHTVVQFNVKLYFCKRARVNGLLCCNHCSQMVLERVKEWKSGYMSVFYREGWLVIIVIIKLGLPIKPPHHAIVLIAGFSLSGFTGTSYQCHKSMTVPRTAVFSYIHETCISVLTQLMVEVYTVEK